ncbi:Methyltransferase domain-containing protein [Jannaschia faecimaris]|uniref:Methyltransferase domain-containing protein n=1 Tax=Jannaschia faecimaris TaxID=1244108 RepID=A0A1H3JP90_9RHOB|nr:class I SAM-dependent methyltransferase [Jannaschia faecimaris]SDY41753.1 Methyltransferase domain-containing protein [Jannaschia faecimaris]
MNENAPDLLDNVARYYADKLAQHGATARGVDWNSTESQFLRFEKLSSIINTPNTPFSIIDLGCGYAATVDYLSRTFSDFDYCGVDISGEMIAIARARYQDYPKCRFVEGSIPDARADYCIASGIFNVRLDHSDSEWLDHLIQTLDVMDRFSRRGFAFNCLTSWSDADRMRETLYYPDPAKIFSLCVQHYGRHVALLHDYELYEFTILVRKAG